MAQRAQDTWCFGNSPAIESEGGRGIKVALLREFCTFAVNQSARRHDAKGNRDTDWRWAEGGWLGANAQPQGSHANKRAMATKEAVTAYELGVTAASLNNLCAGKAWRSAVYRAYLTRTGAVNI